MADCDLESDGFWKQCTGRRFYQLIEAEYSELGLDERIDGGLKFAVKLGLQHAEEVCEECGQTCKLIYRSDRNSCAMRCRKCRRNSSAFDGTFKGKCGNVSWANLLAFIWHYIGLECTTSNSAISSGVSKKAGIDWANHVRFVMLVSLHNLTSFKIGGVGKTVEIDEIVICKRKYEKGRKMKSTKWVVGGLCREDKTCFICQVNDRSEITLNWIISKYVNSGSSVFTDEWKGYNYIDDLEGIEISHKTVNHSENFVNPITGVHTQNIERLWGHLKNKKNLPKHYTEDLSDSYMYAFMYKKYHNWTLKNPGEKFHTFIKHVRMIFPGRGKVPSWKEPETIPAAPAPIAKKKKVEKNENIVKRKAQKRSSSHAGESSSVDGKRRKRGKAQ